MSTEKKLNSQTAYELLTEGIITNEKDLSEDKNRWIMHCIYTGIAAGRIAERLQCDADYAKALGYIHDIGRRISHPKHPTEGYFYMKGLGYDEKAMICLTHSFIDNDITKAAGPFLPEEAYNIVQPHLFKNSPSIYDSIIQLCDLFCLETGFTTLEKRILDISTRKGVVPGSFEHFQSAINLKQRLEKAMGNISLYSLFPEISEEDLLQQEDHYNQLIELFETTSFKKLNVGLDIDNVVSDFDGFLEEEFAKEDKNKRDRGIINPEGSWLKDCYDWSLEEVDRFFEENMEEFATRLPVKDGAQYNMHKLHHDGHRVTLISNRVYPHYTNAYFTTKNWLDENHLYYDDLVLSTSSDKSQECRDYNIDIMYDDNPYNCRQLINSGIDCSLVGTNYWKKEKEGLRIVANWKELCQEVNDISMQQSVNEMQTENKKLVKAK